MKPLNLHLKITMLVSAITLTIMIALLFVISARMVDQIRSDEKALTDLATVSLAEHLSEFPFIASANELKRAAELVHGTRLDEVNVKYWEAVDQEFRIRLADSNEISSEKMPDQVAAKLLRHEVVKIETGRVIEPENSKYRVFAPIVKEGKLIGAVEISDHLDNLPRILKKTAMTAIALAILAVGLITLAIFIMFRDLVYKPISYLNSVIERASSGELQGQVPERRNDELGRLARAFNQMLRQLHEMNNERERQRETLRDRVQEATAQLEERNLQLEAANLEMWKMSRRLTQLERLSAAGQMAAQFAHEVGTPLNLISCHAQLMQEEEENSPEVVQERAGIIVEQTDRIERIVRKMLDRTRHELPVLVPINLNFIVRKVTAAMAPVIHNAKVDLSLDLALSLPQISGDTDKIQQVFINLVNNAIAAMPNGGGLSIVTELSRDQPNLNQQVVAIISDTGSGMTEEVLSHIFDPLYTTKEKGKGTGLGLVVVKQVMIEHEGTITVDSEVGKGSVFTLHFPVTEINASNPQNREAIAVTSSIK